MGIKKRQGRAALRRNEDNYLHDEDVAFAASEAIRVKNWQRRQDDFRELFEMFSALMGVLLCVVSVFISLNRVGYYWDFNGLFFQALSAASIALSLLFLKGRQNSGTIRSLAGGLALAVFLLFMRNPGYWAGSKCAPLCSVYFLLVWWGVSYTSVKHPPKLGDRQLLRSRVKYGGLDKTS